MTEPLAAVMVCGGYAIVDPLQGAKEDYIKSIELFHERYGCDTLYFTENEELKQIRSVLLTNKSNNKINYKKEYIYHLN